MKLRKPDPLGTKSSEQTASVAAASSDLLTGVGQTDSDQFAQRLLTPWTEHRQKLAPGLQCNLSSVVRAAYALEPHAGEFLPETVRPAPSKRTIYQDRQSLKRLLRTEMVDHSIEEVRRTLVEENPRFTKAYVETELVPHLNLERRPIDDFGDEPRLLVAAHLAQHLLGAPIGQTEKAAVREFIKTNKSLEAVWPDFGPEHVAQLRQMYPFIPKWGTKKKTDEDLSIEQPYANAMPLELRIWTDRVLEAVDALAKIPLSSPIIQRVNDLRQEKGCLRGARYVDASHALADKIPLLQSLIGYDGLRGEDISVVVKHYSGDARKRRVMDVMQRVFGISVDLASDDAEVQQKAKAAISNAVTGDDQRPVLIHMGGVHAWDWVDQLAQKHPEVPIAAVSHTTSDGNDLLGEKGNVAFPCELMSLSAAKQADERERFRHSLRAMIDKIGGELDQAIYARRFIVKGYGRIMGPAMAEALKSMGVDFAVHDTDPKARDRAREAGFPVIENFDAESDRKLFVLGCANGPAIEPEEIANLEHPAIFAQVQTGREAFPMEWIEAQSRRKNGVVKRQVKTWVGDQPVCEYTIGKGKSELKHLFVADGFVANLAFPRPAITEYSIHTSVLIEESLRQAMWRVKRLIGGDESQRGTHKLESIQIELTPGKPRRLVTLFDRAVHSLTLKPIEQLILESEELAAFFEKHSDTTDFFRSALTQPKPGSALASKPREDGHVALPKPGVYESGAGQVMTPHRSTDGAWSGYSPKTNVGRYAHEIVRHRFKKGTSEWDGSIDDKAFRELVELGKAEGLIKWGKKKTARNIDKFLGALRPYQLDFIKEGAEALVELCSDAGCERTFFEISAEWNHPGTWSDARANAQLAERLAGR